MVISRRADCLHRQVHRSGTYCRYTLLSSGEIALRIRGFHAGRGSVLTDTLYFYHWGLQGVPVRTNPVPNWGTKLPYSVANYYKI